MKKPYADSTLRRKYKETGIPQETIDTIAAYLHACAAFYYAVEVDDIKSILQDQGHIFLGDVEILLPIFERDDRLPVTRLSTCEKSARSPNYTRHGTPHPASTLNIEPTAA